MLARSVCLCFLVTLSVACAGCNAQKSALSELRSVLGEGDYTLYTPFRTADKPGTIFVQAKNHEGRRTEFTLSSSVETFGAGTDMDSQYVKGDEKVADVIHNERSFDGSIASQLMTLIFSAEATAKYAKSVDITLGDSQKVLKLTTAKVANLVDRVPDDVKKALNFYKAREQLDQCYFVTDTLEVSSLRAVGTFKDEWVGKIETKDLKPFEKLGAHVEVKGSSKFEVSFGKPMLVGFKAAKVPDTLLGGAISGAEQPYERVPAAALDAALFD